MTAVASRGEPAELAAEPADPDVAATFVGLITRAIAFALDAAVINLVALTVTSGGALIVSILHLPGRVKDALLVIGAVAWVLWTIGYFIGFWSTTGQTPGARVMRFRVISSQGGGLPPRRALVRCIGLVLAALPLFAGYLPILLDFKRRGLHDRMAGTCVIDAPQLSLAAQRRAARRAAVAVDPGPRDPLIPFG